MLRVMSRLVLLVFPVLAGFMVGAPSARAAEPPASEPPTTGRQGWFGVGLEPAGEQDQRWLGVTHAVPHVTRVFKGSPAETSGIQVGDFVIALDGADLTTVGEMVQKVGAKPPGTLVVLTIRRRAVVGALRLQAMLDLRPDMHALYRKDWVGRAMPTLAVRPVGTDTDLGLGGAHTAGRVVVLDYFATWCRPCRIVMPQLGRLQERYRKDGLLVVGVSSESEAILSDFFKTRPIGYTVAADPHGHFKREMAVGVMPTLWVIGPDGKVDEVFLGAGHDRELEQRIQALLKRRPGGPAPTP